MNQEQKPRFAIINTCDAPQRRMVCEWYQTVGYCYMVRHEDRYMREYDGMNPSNPTAIETFGFSVEIHGDEAIFRRTGDSTATYEDGLNRPWQDRVWDQQFSLPLVRGPFKRRKKCHKKG